MRYTPVRMDRWQSTFEHRVEIGEVAVRLEDGLQIEAHFLQYIDSHPLAQFDQTQKQMFCANVVVVEPIGLFPREGQHLLGSGCEIIHHLGLLALYHQSRGQSGFLGAF